MKILLKMNSYFTIHAWATLMKMSEQIRTLNIVQHSIVDPPIMPRHATVVIMNIIGNYCWKNTYKVMAV